MSISNYVIADPNASYISPSADSNVENNEGWIVINGTTLRIISMRTPSSSTAAGIVGEMCVGKTTLLGIDSYWLYYCFATNSWVRAAFAGF